MTLIRKTNFTTEERRKIRNHKSQSRIGPEEKTLGAIVGFLVIFGPDVWVDGKSGRIENEVIED
jgi:hypothetical protein